MATILKKKRAIINVIVTPGGFPDLKSKSIIMFVSRRSSVHLGRKNLFDLGANQYSVLARCDTLVINTLT